MTDVTLAVGHQFYSAHRFMLSLTSPFFRSLFTRLSHQTPVVFLKDVDPGILELLLQFVYKGEVDVPQHQLRTFLLTARSLEIMGLQDYQDSDLGVAAPPVPDHRSHKRTNESIEESPEKRTKPARTELEDSERVQIKLEIDPTDLTDPQSQYPDQTETESQHTGGGGPVKLEEPGCSSSSSSAEQPQRGLDALVYSQPVSCSWCQEYFDRRANPLPCFKCNLWFHLKCRCRHEC